MVIEPIFKFIDSMNQFVAMIFVFIVFLVLLQIFQYALFTLFKKAAARTKTKLDDELLDKLKKPMRYFFVYIAVWFALMQINFGEYKSIIDNILSSIFVLFIANFVIVFLNVVVRQAAKHAAKKTRSEIDEHLVDFTHKFVLITVWVISFVIILSIFGVKIGPILASLGIAGLAIGLALQDTLKNIFGGVSLILDREFKVGDTIKLQSGEEGTITEVGLRSTRILTYDHEELIVPNGIIANTAIINYALPKREVRVVVRFGVKYGSDIEKVKKVVLDAINKLGIIKDKKPLVQFIEMGDFAMIFRAVFWIDDFDKRMQFRDEANTAIYNALNKAGIEIPFPTRTIYVKREE